MSHKIIPVFAAAMLIAATTTACGESHATDANPHAPTSINVTVTNATEPYVIPWLIARSQGMFKKRGVKVNQIVPSKGGATSVRNLLSGDLPIGEVGLTSVVESSQAKAPVLIFGGGTQSAFGLDFYALSTSSIRTIGDIHTWAYTNPQSITQSMTYLLPEAAGITKKLKRVSSGGVGEGIALLEAGDVDAAVLPSSVAAKGSPKFRLVVSSSQYIKSLQQTVLTTTPEYAKSHPKVVTAVAAGYAEAITWLKANPKKAAALYASYGDIPDGVAMNLVEKGIKDDSWNVGFTRAALTTAEKAMTVSGIKLGSEFCGLFDLSFLPKTASAELPADCS